MKSYNLKLVWHLNIVNINYAAVLDDAQNIRIWGVSLRAPEKPFKKLDIDGCEKLLSNSDLKVLVNKWNLNGGIEKHGQVGELDARPVEETGMGSFQLFLKPPFVLPFQKFLFHSMLNVFLTQNFSLRLFWHSSRTLKSLRILAYKHIIFTSSLKEKKFI